MFVIQTNARASPRQKPKPMGKADKWPGIYLREAIDSNGPLDIQLWIRCRLCLPIPSEHRTHQPANPGRVTDLIWKPMQARGREAKRGGENINLETNAATIENSILSNPQSAFHSTLQWPVIRRSMLRLHQPFNMKHCINTAYHSAMSGQHFLRSYLDTEEKKK